MSETRLVRWTGWVFLFLPAALLMAAETAPERGSGGIFLVLQLLTAVVATFALAGVAYLITQVKRPVSPPEPAVPQKVERLAGFDHSFREISRQLVELKNEVGAVQNALQALEARLESSESQQTIQETLPGTSARLGRVPSAAGIAVPGANLRAAIESYCAGSIGVEALLESARQAHRRWGAGRGNAYGYGRAAEVAVEWDQVRNLPLIVIEREDSTPVNPSYWILVNGFRKFSEYLVVAFREPEPLGTDVMCRTRIPGEGVLVAEDRIRVERIGEVATG